jgi:hypothetical protein
VYSLTPKAPFDRWSIPAKSHGWEPSGAKRHVVPPNHPPCVRSSALRKVSLTRLERELQIRAARGLPADEELQALAGLQRIQYVFVYPESGDVVLAGPAGDWYFGPRKSPLGRRNRSPRRAAG